MAKGFAYFLHIGDTPRIPVGRKPTLIICSPARQFPTGAIMPMTRRMELVAFAKRTGAYLLEDNFESEFNYEAPPTSSLFEFAPECVLSAGTFSRCSFRLCGWATSWRRGSWSPRCARKSACLTTTPIRSISLHWRHFCATGSSNGTPAA